MCKGTVTVIKVTYTPTMTLRWSYKKPMPTFLLNVGYSKILSQMTNFLQASLFLTLTIVQLVAIVVTCGNAGSVTIEERMLLLCYCYFSAALLACNNALLFTQSQANNLATLSQSGCAFFVLYTFTLLCALHFKPTTWNHEDRENTVTLPSTIQSSRSSHKTSRSFFLETNNCMIRNKGKLNQSLI